MKPIPYATQWIDEEDIDSVERALRSPFLTQGPLVERFEPSITKILSSLKPTLVAN